MKQRAGLYIHIPFCARKCVYCDFNSYAGLRALHEEYLAALAREAAWARRALLGNVVFDTVYIGGGTPTLLDITLMERLFHGCLGALPLARDAEVTVEANPGTVDHSYLRRLRVLGATRLSLGVQSFDDRTLRALGRVHDARAAAEAFQEGRAAGFRDINLDLIYALPAQSVEEWELGLARALALAPEHLSLYALTLEDDTPLQRAVASGRLAQPDEDRAATMYQLAELTLAAAGYEHYEISNWARPGHRCRHNARYWRMGDYLGLGAGAHSFWRGRRWANEASPDRYAARVRAAGEARCSSEEPEREREMADAIILGLRMVDGISVTEWENRYDMDFHARYGEELSFLDAQGLVSVDGDRLALSARGRLLGNEVFVRFLP